MKGIIYYGYTVVDGKAKVDETQAAQVRTLYDNYLAGDSLYKAAAKAGICTWHGQASRMISNSTYLGTEFYPAIIDEETFQKAQEERHKRAVALGRINRKATALPNSASADPEVRFWMKKVEVKFTDPYKQAEFAYSLIEREVR